MNCFINPKFSDISLLRLFLRDDIKIVLDVNNIIDSSNDLILSNLPELVEKRTEYLTVNYDSIVDYFGKYTLERFYNHYDYNYLLNSIEDACRGDIDTIFLGSSYPCFGVDCNLMETKAKNLSSASQDTYYSCKIAEKVIDKNKNIKNIFIGVGYYSFFSDLSKTKNECQRISDVYYPLLSDMHNAITIPETRVPIQSDIFDIKRIISLLSRRYYDMNKGQYFNPQWTRFNSKYCLWKDESLDWNQITLEEKIMAGIKRANEHNKLIKYNTSYEENILILKDFVKLCNANNISLSFVVFPSTKYYFLKLDSQYRKYFYEALDMIDGEFRLIDFNEYNNFNDLDFVDTDHLSDEGAIKLTRLLNGLLSKV